MTMSMGNLSDFVNFGIIRERGDDYNLRRTNKEMQKELNKGAVLLYNSHDWQNFRSVSRNSKSHLSWKK
jgi:hypothetical protein